ncbi:molybdenum cofactor biosynthesis protein A [Actinomadura rubteroloni]|uniref:Molybdenum cofactor biosynthesis protein A n=1 Tax=Actinomadura rubteroloni TaxID=1926885 RepID=A0A2P4UJU7_9ACTN|nr:radical SAM protein [Actinomadura rubteroloni]POM25288.1 molybdenum cofactor biosynthesis protein A [Actinomadura rubteroloni]
MGLGRLDLVGKLYQPAVWPKVATAARGATPDAPVVVDLDPTTFCDLACPECISGKLLNQGRLTPARLAELADEIVAMGVDAVILIGGGEPLAHRGTRRALATLGAGGVAIGVVTNGTLIGQNLDELSRYAYYVRVSVDAASTDTYGRFRPDRQGRSVFDRVIGNMRAFAARKKGALGYSFLVMTREDGTSNHHEVLAAAELAKDIGCDYFEVKAMFDDEHHIVGVADAILESVESQLAMARKLEGDDFSIIDSSTLAALRAGAGRDQPKDYATCKVANLRTLITPSGVYICPYHRGNPKARLGDAVTDSLPVIWRDADRAVIDPRTDCTFHCARHDSNLELDRIEAGKGRELLAADDDLFL